MKSIQDNFVKVLLFWLVLVLLATAIHAVMAKAEDECEPHIIQVSHDKAGSFMYWIDNNCDQECDAAVVFIRDKSSGVHMMNGITCDMADRIQHGHDQWLPMNAL